MSYYTHALEAMETIMKTITNTRPKTRAGTYAVGENQISIVIDKPELITENMTMTKYLGLGGTVSMGETKVNFTVGTLPTQTKPITVTGIRTASTAAPGFKTRYHCAAIQILLSNRTILLFDNPAFNLTLIVPPEGMVLPSEMLFESTVPLYTVKDEAAMLSYSAMADEIQLTPESRSFVVSLTKEIICPNVLIPSARDVIFFEVKPTVTEALSYQRKWVPEYIGTQAATKKLIEAVYLDSTNTMITKFVAMEKTYHAPVNSVKEIPVSYTGLQSVPAVCVYTKSSPSDTAFTPISKIKLLTTTDALITESAEFTPDETAMSKQFLHLRGTASFYLSGDNIQYGQDSSRIYGPAASVNLNTMAIFSVYTQDFLLFIYTATTATSTAMDANVGMLVSYENSTQAGRLRAAPRAYTVSSFGDAGMCASGKAPYFRNYNSATFMPNISTATFSNGVINPIVPWATEENNVLVTTHLDSIPNAIATESRGFSVFILDNYAETTEAVRRSDDLPVVNKLFDLDVNGDAITPNSGVFGYNEYNQFEKWFQKFHKATGIIGYQSRKEDTKKYQHSTKPEQLILIDAIYGKNNHLVTEYPFSLGINYNSKVNYSAVYWKILPDKVTLMYDYPSAFDNVVTCLRGVPSGYRCLVPCTLVLSNYLSPNLNTYLRGTSLANTTFSISDEENGGPLNIIKAITFTPYGGPSEEASDKLLTLEVTVNPNASVYPGGIIDLNLNGMPNDVKVNISLPVPDDWDGVSTIKMSKTYRFWGLFLDGTPDGNTPKRAVIFDDTTKYSKG